MDDNSVGDLNEDYKTELDERSRLHKEIADSYHDIFRFLAENPKCVDSIVHDLYIEDFIDQEASDYVENINPGAEKADRLLETIMLSKVSTIEYFITLFNKYSPEVDIETKSTTTTTNQQYSTLEVAKTTIVQQPQAQSYTKDKSKDLNYTQLSSFDNPYYQNPSNHASGHKTTTAQQTAKKNVTYSYSNVIKNENKNKFFDLNYAWKRISSCFNCFKCLKTTTTTTTSASITKTTTPTAAA